MFFSILGIALFGQCIVSTWGQYNYAPNYNRRYVIVNEDYGQPPCKSSCGNYRPISYCNRLPCYSQSQQPYYIPYQTQRKVVSYPYQNVLLGNNRVSSSRSYLDPYENVPVDIIDESNAVQWKNQYANIPTEIIDESDGQWQRIPIRPKLSRANKFSVSYGAISTNSSLHNPPIRTTVTRTFTPNQKQKEVRLDFLNGVLVANNETPSPDIKPEVTTALPQTTEEENEDVSAVDNWNVSD